jgi:hypothetical protein
MLIHALDRFAGERVTCLSSEPTVLPEKSLLGRRRVGSTRSTLLGFLFENNNNV